MPATALLRPALAGLLAAVLVFLVWDALDRAPADRNGEWSYARAVEAAAPAVVNVYSARLVARPDASDSPLFREFFGDGGEARRRATTLGSGVILAPDGLIVTNHHVVADADEIEVSLADGRRLAAHLVGSDPETDLAVLRIEAAGLPVVPRSPLTHPAVGDVVLALGNPWGVGQAVTLGIVGATGRDRLGLNTFEDFIQHDAAINPGHSGGALVNPRGELVGINTAMFSRSGGSDGIGFAIPAALVTHVVQQIVEHGAVMRGWLGVDARNLPSTAASGGVRIAGVFRGSPADAAGLQAGDILLAINDQPLANLDDLLQHTTNAAPGTHVHLQVLRDGDELMREATLIQRPTP